MEKKLSEITRTEWIKFQWIDVTQGGDQERFMLSTFRRTPDEAMEAMRDWDMTQEERDAPEEAETDQEVE